MFIAFTLAEPMAVDPRKEPLIESGSSFSPTRNDRNGTNTARKLEDKLVCGKCAMEFYLTDLKQFLQHKEKDCTSNLTAPLVHRIQEALAISLQYRELESVQHLDGRNEYGNLLEPINLIV